MMNGLVKYDDVIKLVQKVCLELLDQCEHHYDEELQDEVYSNTKEVDLILQSNKKLRNGLKALEMKHGRWIFEEYPDGYYHAECTACGIWVSDSAYRTYNFCPYCGARMEDNT